MKLFFSILILICCFSCDSEKHSYPESDIIEPSDYYISSTTNSNDLPLIVDLRKKKDAFPPIYNQSSLNNCTSNAVAAALYYDMFKQKSKEPFLPSRLFIYYNERKICHRLNESKYGSKGALVKLKTCIDALEQYGICDEVTWPYETGKIYVKPPKEAYNQAEKIKKYDSKKIRSNLNDLKNCLADGYPFLFGFHIYESFKSTTTIKSGVVPLPLDNEKKWGGHAALVVGYDEAKQQFIFRNSFGTNWGDSGYGYISYEFMLKFGFDFWVIKMEEK